MNRVYKAAVALDIMYSTIQTTKKMWHFALQVHLLMLIAHGFYRNSICNDSFIQVSYIYSYTVVVKFIILGEISLFVDFIIFLLFVVVSQDCSICNSEITFKKNASRASLQSLFLDKNTMSPLICFMGNPLDNLFEWCATSFVLRMQILVHTTSQGSLTSVYYVCLNRHTVCPLFLPT